MSDGVGPESPIDGPEQHAIGRRELIRQGAAVGGVVWTLPLIKTVHAVQDPGSPPPDGGGGGGGGGGSTCCTCNCSDENGRVILQSCNRGVGSSSDCETVCREFCEGQDLFPEAVGFLVSDTGDPTCQTTTLPGAEGQACGDFTKPEPVVILDTMPGNAYFIGGSESARTPGAFGLDEKQDVAEGFVVGGQDSQLQSLDMALHFQQGVNSLDVFLVNDRTRAASPGFEPDDSSVLEHWTLTNIPGSLTPTGNLIHVESALHPDLLAGQRYWVYLSVSGAATAIGWISGALGSGPFLFATRNTAFMGFQWVVGEAHETRALRVTVLQ